MRNHHREPKVAKDFPFANYPFPLAAAYKNVYEQEDYDGKLKTTFIAYEQVLIYFTILLLAVYRQDKEENVEIDCSRFGNLAFNNWFPFFKNILNEFSDQSLLVREIKSWYEEVEENQRVYITEVVDYKHVKRDLGHLSNLMEIEKNLFPIFAGAEKEGLEEYYNFCHKSLKAVFKSLNFVNNHFLYWIEARKSENEYVAKELNGPDRNFKKTPIHSSQELVPQQIYLFLKPSNEFYSLHPFMVYQDCYYCIRDELIDTKEVFSFQCPTSRRLCYVGAIHKAALREHIQEYKENFLNKSFSIGEVSIKEVWEKAFQITEERLEELKNITLFGKFCSRKGAEFELENFVENASFPLFALVGVRGAGKTVLLAEMAKRWASQGKVVFFLRAFGQESNIEEYLSSLLGGGEHLIQLRAGQDKWIIVLDGIENATDPKKLLVGVRNFASAYKKNVRIVLSVRDMYHKYFHEHFSSELFMPVQGKCPLIETSQPFFHLDNFSMAAGKDIYVAISQNRLGPLTSYEDFPKNVKGMLCNPAIGRVFLWALKNRELPRYLGIRDIMEGFVMNQINSSKDRREFVERFAEVLMQRKQVKMSLDEIIETDDPKLIDEILHFAGPCTLMGLIKEGVLERTPFYEQNSNNILLRFPITVIQEYLMYRITALAGKHSDEFLPKYFKEICEGNFHLLGIVYFAMVRLADKHYFDRFAKVVKTCNSPNPFVRQIIYDILRFKEKSSTDGGTVEGLIEALLAESTKDVLLALADFAVKLYGEENYTVAAALLEKLSAHFTEPIGQYDALPMILLSARAFQYLGDVKRAAKLYKKSFKLLKKVENTPKEAEIASFLGKAYYKLGDIQKAEYFFERCRALYPSLRGTLLEEAILGDFGFIAEQHGKLEDALRYYQKQYEILDEKERLDKIGFVQENMARLYYKMRNREESKRILEDAMHSFLEVGDEKQIALCKKKLGKLLLETESPKNVISYFIDALNILESLDEKTSLAGIYMDLEKIYENLGKREECRVYLNKAMNVQREVGDDIGLAKSFERLGEIASGQGDNKDAMEKYTSAMEIYKRYNNASGIATIHNLIGMLYNSQGNFANAFNHYNESLKIRHQIQDAVGMAETYNNLAIVLAHEGNFPSALEKLQESKRIYAELKDLKGIATTKATEALLNKLQSNSSKALECYQEAAQAFEKIKEVRLLGTIYNSIGLIYKEKGDFYNALSFFEKGAKVQESVKDLPGLAASYNNIGLIYDAKNEYEKALEYYTKDLEITKRLGDKRGLATSYNNIAILHYNHRNYARALWYLEKSIPLYEELDDKDMVKKVKERIQYVREKL